MTERRDVEFQVGGCEVLTGWLFVPKAAETSATFPSVARPRWPILNLSMLFSAKCNVRTKPSVQMVRSISL